MQILNKTKNCIIASSADKADTFISRMVGLLGRNSISRDEALIITQCKSIHMLFMKFPIDVLFVSKEHKVVGIVENIKPSCLSRIYPSASYAIELSPGVISVSDTSLGDEIEIAEET